jgi:hypothetical protein
MPEIVAINQADQFQPGRTAFACGFFSVAECCSMAPPGQPPTRSVQQIINDAETWYGQYDGPNNSQNERGMTLAQLYELLHQAGLHYQSLPPSIEAIHGWIGNGYPVIVAAQEAAIHDLDLGGRVPYPWPPTGSHLFIITGLDGNNLLCRDSASIVPPNTIRPGPRRYDAALLAHGLISATVVVPPWKPRPLSADPVTGLPPLPAPAPQPSSLSPELRSALIELSNALQPLWTAYNALQTILKGK